MVSIIVPTYNRADGLESALKMLTNQTYADLEIIVVNDGSSDNTSDVLKKLAKTDSRIKIKNKSNGGPSEARNIGIENSSGDYLFFIDDDDFVPEDYIEIFMLPEYDGIDLVIDSYSTQLDDNKPVVTGFEAEYITGSHEIIKKLTGPRFDEVYIFFPHGKRFRRDIIQANDVKFDSRIKLGEDRPFIIDYILNAENCSIINNHKYIVRSVSTNAYRLSKGNKDSSWLWHNFKIGYDYLLKIANSEGVASVKRYSDNYLATRLIDYLYMPYADGAYHRDKDKLVIKESARFLIDNVDAQNIGHYGAKVFFRLLNINFNLAVSFLRARIIGSIIKRILK